jgi:hypothetical protein
VLWYRGAGRKEAGSCVQDGADRCLGKPFYSLIPSLLSGARVLTHAHPLPQAIIG